MSDALNLGKIIAGEAQRDAIHIAVAPVVATERVHPGQRVNANGGPGQPHVGIVDPFLDRAAMVGDRFWLFLFPNTVTSLRHDWVHPAFDNERTEAEKWLRAYAAKMNCYDDAETAFASLIDGLRTKDLTAHGSDLYGPPDDAEELRRYAEIYLGAPIGDWSQFSFSCSC